FRIGDLAGQAQRLAQLAALRDEPPERTVATRPDRMAPGVGNHRRRTEMVAQDEVKPRLGPGRMLEEADYPPLPAQPGSAQAAVAVSLREQLPAMVEIAVALAAGLADNALAERVVAVPCQHLAVAAGAANPSLRTVVEGHAAMTRRQAGGGGRA